MNTVAIKNVLNRKFYRAGLKLKKHSPEILLVAGVVGTVASAVMACKATLKVNEVLDETKENIDRIHTSVERGFTPAGEEYVAEDSKKDLALVYVQTGLKFAKLYGPAIVLGAASVGCILSSHNIIHKRNVGLAAAYATIDQGFKEYRERVVERFGEELDRELKYNIRAREIEETVINEDGTESTVPKTIQTAEINQHSQYARFFDETCVNWERNAERNLFFLLQQQNYANEKLQAQTYLFLNDVYEMLGFQKTAAGQVVGWVYDEKHPIGANFIDFGIHDLYDEQKRAFVNGYEKSILLDFNVDGDILKYI